MGNKYEKFKNNDDYPLKAAQYMRTTRNGMTINQKVSEKALTMRELDRLRRNPKTSTDVRIVLNPPFSNVDRITDNLYLTGVGGLVEENIRNLKITCIINATYEMPLLRLKGIEAIRVPVDDDPDEEIMVYFDEVSNVIHSVAENSGRTILHCMAGASRSSTLTLAYLIKYQDLSLKKAFCYLKTLRPCARPNIAFFAQLIVYEKFYRNRNSVKIVEVEKEGRTIMVPDFYRSMFPDLYRAEVAKQLSRASTIITKSASHLEGDSKNYYNAKRKYHEIHNDIANQLD